MSTNTVNIKVTKTQSSRIKTIDFDNLPFGKYFADHMLVMDYEDGKWGAPQIVPFGNIEIHPATSALHYGQSIFEGLKAQRNEKGEVVVFRPEMNAKRFRESAERMCMVPVPEEIFLEGVRALIELDREWVPTKDNTSLYIRPFLFATDDYVGIRPSEKYKFMIINSPVGAYYSEPVKVKIETYYTRAAEGGVGRAKAAGNYAASLYPAKLGQEKGYRQLLWTDAKTHTFIEESGTMNVMFMINDVLITPSEDRDSILKGITKRSVIEIAQDWGIKVEERDVTVAEVMAAIENGTLQDAFGVGTAATIAPIIAIGYNDKEYALPSIESRTVSQKIANYVADYKAGKVEDKFNWLMKI
jgi:branched-chain amino acid aminotransferase